MHCFLKKFLDLFFYGKNSNKLFTLGQNAFLKRPFPQTDAMQSVCLGSCHRRQLVSSKLEDERSLFCTKQASAVFPTRPVTMRGGRSRLGHPGSSFPLSANHYFSLVGRASQLPLDTGQACTFRWQDPCLNNRLGSQRAASCESGPGWQRTELVCTKAQGLLSPSPLYSQQLQLLRAGGWHEKARHNFPRMEFIKRLLEAFGWNVFPL